MDGRVPFPIRHFGIRPPVSQQPSDLEMVPLDGQDQGRFALAV